MVLTRYREEALAGFCLILFGKIIPGLLYETSREARVDFSLSVAGPQVHFESLFQLVRTSSKSCEDYLFHGDLDLSWYLYIELRSNRGEKSIDT